MSSLSCSPLRAALGEPMHGSAPVAPRGWLLVEHPGPWPAEAKAAATDGGALPAEAADALARAADLGLRAQLIRRTRERRTRPHQVYVAHSAGPRPWLRGGEIDDLRALADLDLGGVASGRRPDFGTEVRGRLLLVCTNGRQDPCCARIGRPVAAALAGAHGDAVWETTHVGGDRYAANVVTLPEGTYHGGTDPHSARAVAEAALRGAVELTHYRGRAGLPAAAQSAEWYARQATGVLDVAAVIHLGLRDLDAETAVAELEVAGRPLAVTVRRRAAECPRATSCGAADLDRPDHHVLVAIDAMVAA